MVMPGDCDSKWCRGMVMMAILVLVILVPGELGGREEVGDLGWYSHW